MAENRVKLQVEIITPRACARGKVITVSRHLSDNETVEIIEKLALLSFKSFGKAHESHKCSTNTVLYWSCIYSLYTVHGV